MHDITSASTRDCFAAATACFVELVARVPDSGWDDPALGVWNVRDLVGHVAGPLGQAPELLLLITGRTGLRKGISIV